MPQGKSGNTPYGNDGQERPVIFQKYFKSGNRTYASQIKIASNGKKYLALTEGTRDPETQEVKKKVLRVFDQDLKEFFAMLQETVVYLRNTKDGIPAEAPKVPAQPVAPAAKAQPKALQPPVVPEKKMPAPVLKPKASGPVVAPKPAPAAPGKAPTTGVGRRPAASPVRPAPAAASKPASRFPAKPAGRPSRPNGR